MDPKKKSALTAALSSNPPESQGGQGDQAASTKADTFSFPCLADGAPSNVDDIAAGVERVDLSRRPTLAGSAPTAPRLSSTMTVRGKDMAIVFTHRTHIHMHCKHMHTCILLFIHYAFFDRNVPPMCSGEILSNTSWFFTGF